MASKGDADTTQPANQLGNHAFVTFQMMGISFSVVALVAVVSINELL